MNKELKIKKLKQLWMEGLSLSSLALSREILKKYPDEVLILNISGNALSSLERYNEAILVLEKAIKFSTKDEMYRTLVTMAFVYFQRGSYSEAEEWYSKAFNVHNPRQIDRVLYSECLLKRGKYSIVIEDLTKFISETKIISETTYYTLGIAYRAQEEYVSALEYFRKSLHIDPDYDMALLAHKDMTNYLKKRES